MKKALLAALATAAIFAGTASAATPQGKLTGTGTFGPGLLNVNVIAPVIDGGTTFVGAGNDLTGSCSGDSGSIQFDAHQFGSVTVPVVCAHYVASSGALGAGSPKMRLTFQVPGGYGVVRITDNGNGPLDTVGFGFAPSLAAATAWVNTGATGSGGSWTFTTLNDGDYAVAAAQ